MTPRRMTAGIMSKVEQLQVLAKKQDRRLKDIQVRIQWAIDKFDNNKDTDENMEYSGFTAAQVYNPSDLRNLLQSPRSVLSLQIGDLSDDSVSMIWTPDSTSAMSPKRVKSVVSPAQLTPGELDAAQGLILETYPSIETTKSSLQNLADIYTLAERSSRRRSRQYLNRSLGDINTRQLHQAINIFAGQANLRSPFVSSFLDGFKLLIHLLDSVKESSQYIMEDLRDIGDLITAMDFAGKDIEIEHSLSELKDRVFASFLEYMNYATDHFKARTSIFPLTTALWRR